MRVADVFESIFGQAQVRDYLRTTLRTGPLEPRLSVHRASWFQQDLGSLCLCPSAHLS